LADFVAEAQEICRRTIERGDGKPLLDRIAEMVAWAKTELGISVGQIETRLGRKRGQWTAADLADLKVVMGSIRRRETTVADEFPDQVTAAEISRAVTPGYVPDPDAAAKAARFPGYIDPSTLVVPEPEPTDDDWPPVPEIPGGEQ
jgi:hypothetical protein